MNTLTRFAFLGLVLSGSAPLGLSQSVIHHFRGDSAGDSLGLSANAGDVNADGWPDIIASAIGVEPAGMVRVYSGKTGATLYTILGTDPDERFGWSVAGVGDINNDGYDDFGYGMPHNGATAPNAGSACIHSGFDGSLLYQFYGDSQTDNFGNRLEGAGDVNGDGHADVIVGIPENDLVGNNAGSARVFSGLDGSILYTWYGGGASDGLGADVAGIGDVDGDGVPDVAVGAWQLTGWPNNGYVKVYSGATGAEIHHITGPTYGGRFGSCVSAAGDVNADGCPDIIVGAPEDETLADDAGAVWVFDGQNGWLLFAVLGDTEDLFLGSYVDGIGDVNGDGYGDVIFSAPWDSDPNPRSGREGSATLISGKDTTVIRKYWGGAPYNYLASVAGAGDVDQDGVPDIILGAAGADSNGQDSGSVRVISGIDCSMVQNYCETSPNSVGPGAVMSYSSSPSISANEFYVICSDVPDDQFGIFYYGAHQGSIPFGNGIRCTAGRVFRLGVIQAQGNVLYQHVDFTQPPHLDGQITVGSAWNFQCWYRDPGAGPAFFNLSDGLNVVFCQ